jgi:hypothetical protein
MQICNLCQICLKDCKKGQIKNCYFFQSFKIYSEVKKPKVKKETKVYYISESELQKYNKPSEKDILQAKISKMA